MNEQADTMLRLLTFGLGHDAIGRDVTASGATPIDERWQVPTVGLVEQLIRDTTPGLARNACTRCGKRERHVYPRITARDCGGIVASSLVDDRPHLVRFPGRSVALSSKAYQDDENTWELRSMAHGGDLYQW